MHALTYRNNQIESGLPMMVMARAFQTAGEGSPGTTLDSVGTHLMLYWHPSMGPGQVIVEPEDGTQQTLSMPYHPRGKRTQPEAALISPPCVLRLVPDEGVGLTIQVSASGAYTVAEGSNATPIPVFPDVPGQSEIQRQARAWLRNGRVGTSSYALCATLAGVEDPSQDQPGPNSVPRDPSDFKRCQAFFQAVPEARPLIGKMQELGPRWSAMAESWDTLEEQADKQDWEELHAGIRKVLEQPLAAASGKGGMGAPRR